MVRSASKVNPAAVASLMRDPRLADDLKRRAEAVATDARSKSSWGGYYGNLRAKNPQAAWVWSIQRVKPGGAEAQRRHVRLVQSLDAARK